MNSKIAEYMKGGIPVGTMVVFVALNKTSPKEIII
jgi:hypothetical protein